LENWPSEVPLPGSGSQSCDDNKGINGLQKGHLLLLYEAVKSKDHPLKLSRIALAEGSASVSLSATSTSDSTDRPDITDVPLNTSRRRNREDDTDGSRRADKRPRLSDEVAVTLIV
jgi:hypothetical protein